MISCCPVVRRHGRFRDPLIIPRKRQMAYYDRIARRWHSVTGYHGGPFKRSFLNELLLDRIGGIDSRAILELGAGNGYFMPMLIRRYSGQQRARLVITDQSGALLDLARQHFGIDGAEYLQLDRHPPIPVRGPRIQPGAGHHGV